MALTAEWVTYSQGENYFTLRFYTTQEQADALVPYDTVATCRVSGDAAYLFAMNGRMTRQYRMDVERWLLDNGLAVCRAERHGREIEYWRKERDFARTVVD